MGTGKQGRGHIFYDPLVDCGVCNDAIHIAPARGESTTQGARYVGYRLSRQWGWVCPQCWARGEHKRPNPQYNPSALQRRRPRQRPR